MCINTFDENQLCTGLLFIYRDQSRGMVGQWRWDFKIDRISLKEGEDAFISCRKDQHETRAPDVKIEISAEKTACQDDLWERHLLEGQIMWWFSSSGNYIVFQ